MKRKPLIHYEVNEQVAKFDDQIDKMKSKENNSTCYSWLNTIELCKIKYTYEMSVGICFVSALNV